MTLLGAAHLTGGLIAQANVFFTFSQQIGAETGGSDPGQLWFPVGLAVGPQDRVYVADTANDRIQIFDKNGGLPIAGFGSSGYAEERDDNTGYMIDAAGNRLLVQAIVDPTNQFNYPSGIAVDASTGNFLVVDNQNNRVLMFGPQNPLDPNDLNIVFRRSFGSYKNYDVTDPLSSPTPTLTGLNSPTRVAIRPGTRLNDPSDTVGRVVIADCWNHRIIVLNSVLTPLFAFGVHGADGNLPGELETPWGVGMDAQFIYVSEPENHRVQVFNQTGTYVTGFGSDGVGNSPGDLEEPFDVQPAGQGRLIVADENRSRVLFMTPDPSLDLTSLPKCSSVAASFVAGHCWIQALNGTKYDALAIGGFSGTGTEPGKFSFPEAVAMDATGRLLVLDSVGSRVQIFRVASIAITSVSAPTPALVQSGQTVSFDVTVLNQGADAITVRPQVTANRTGTLSVAPAASVPGGTSAPFPVSFVTDDPGQLIFTVKAKGDPPAGASLFSAVVTTAANPVTVASSPDPKVSVSVSTATSVIAVGAAVSIDVLVQNTGGVPLTVTPSLTPSPAGLVTLTSPTPVPADLTVTGLTASKTYTFTYIGVAAGTATFAAGATATYALIPNGTGTIQTDTVSPPSTSVTIDADTVPPVTTAVVSPNPSVSIVNPTTGVTTNWYTSPVTVTFTATDNKGVAAINYFVDAQVDSGLRVPAATAALTMTAAVTITYQGGADLSYWAEDTSVTGNPEIAKTKHFDIDTVKPTIVFSATGGLTPAPNAAGWVNKYPTVKFIAGDGGSGLAFVTGGSTGLLVPNDGGSQVIPGIAKDVAGNSATTTITVNVDTKAPTLICGATVPPTGLNGWYKAGTGTVTVGCIALDQLALSRMKSLKVMCPVTPSNATIATGNAVIAPGAVLAVASCGINAEGISTVLVEAKDVADNLTTQTLTIKIDRTPPVFACSVTAAPIAWPRDDDAMVAWKPVVTVTDRVSSATFKLIAYYSNHDDDHGHDHHGNHDHHGDDDRHGDGDHRGDDDHRRGDDDHRGDHHHHGDHYGHHDHHGDDERDMKGWTLNTPDTSGSVRAERGSHKRPRVYTLKYKATDLAGNISYCQLSVTVPRSTGSQHQKDNDEGNHDGKICHDNKRHTQHKR